LRATGVVDQPIKDAQTAWQNTNVKQYIANVQRFLSEPSSDDFVSSTRLRKLDLNATTRKLFAMSLPTQSSLADATNELPKASPPSLSPINNLDESNPNLDSKNLLPSPISVQSNLSFRYPSPAALSTSSFRGCDVDSNLSEVNKAQEKQPTYGKTPLYNRDWSVLADILKNISNARKEKDACVLKLQAIVEKRDSFKIEVAKLESDWMSTTKKFNLVISPKGSAPQLFPGSPSDSTDNVSDEQKVSPLVSSDQINEEEVVTLSDDESVIV